MAWFSILPESFSAVETWAVRIFILLGSLAMGPWILLLIYDALLFLFRTVTYEIPYVGGRARHRPRPRAPSLSERPSGLRRKFSLSIPGVPSGGMEEADNGLKKRAERPGLQQADNLVMNDE